jgi:predicted dinucleotide-binding enzyme
MQWGLSLIATAAVIVSRLPTPSAPEAHQRTEHHMTSIAVIGSGNVGRSLAAGLHHAGHQVTMGRRDPSLGTLVEGVPALDVPTAISGAEILVNATPGDATVDLFAPLADSVGTRVLVDVSNATRPGTAVALQRALPDARVVKTLSTMLFLVMTAPDTLSAPATAFVSGDDPAAKTAVEAVLNSLGWASEQILDLGGIDTASAVESSYPLAMAVLRARGVAPFALTAVS